MRAIEKELVVLKKPVEEAKAYLTTSAEVIRSEGIIKQIEFMNMKGRADKLEAEVEEKGRVLEEEKKEQEENQVVLRRCEEQYNASLKEATALSKQLEVVKKDWVNFEKKELTLTNEIKVLLLSLYNTISSPLLLPFSYPLFPPAQNLSRQERKRQKN